jgi:hypothetical protein
MRELEQAKWLVIFALCVIIMLMRNCQGKRGGCPEYDIKHDTTYVYRDTGSIKIIEHAPKVVTKKLPSDTVIRNVVISETCQCDTAAILSYYSKNFYQNWYYSHDSLIMVEVNDSIFKNEILSRSVFIANRTPTTIVQPTLVEKKRIKVLVGLQFGTNLQQFTLEPTLAFQTRRDDVIMGGVDLINVERFYRVGYLYKISLRKK